MRGQQAGRMLAPPQAPRPAPSAPRVLAFSSTPCLDERLGAMMAALGGRASCLGLGAARPVAVPPRARLVVEAGRSQKRERQRQRKSADQGKVGGCGRLASAAAADKPGIRADVLHSLQL